jgi:anti-sigma factor RsiW
MNCRRARNLLTRGVIADGELDRHLVSCPECERFAERWAAVRDGIKSHRAAVRPEAGFAARVTARLGAPADPLVWAAWRLVPVTLALTLVLGGWCLLGTPAPASLAAQLADSDLLSWVASSGEEER